MIGQTVKGIALSLLIGLLSFSLTLKSNKLDYSKYTTKGLDLDYTVPRASKVLSQSYLKAPFVINDFIGFREALGFKESQGNYFVVNTFGYLGKYQFGKSTLDLLGITNSFDFLNSPELQEKAFKLNLSRNKWVLRRDIQNFSGKWVNGIHITESGILAAAHLAGPGSVKKYLRSSGRDTFQDAFGTSIGSYLKRFSDFDISCIEANKKPSL